MGGSNRGTPQSGGKGSRPMAPPQGGGKGARPMAPPGGMAQLGQQMQPQMQTTMAQMQQGIGGKGARKMAPPQPQQGDPNGSIQAQRMAEIMQGR